MPPDSMPVQEIPARVRAQLLGRGEWVDPNDREPTDGLARAIRQSGDQRRTFAAAVGLLLTDDDPALRAGAAAVLHLVADELGAPHLARLLTEHPERYRGVRPAGVTLGGEDIAWTMLTAMAKVTRPQDRDAVHLLRGAVTEPERGSRLLADLARVDPDWVTANARDVVPHRATGVLLRLDRPHRERLARALAPYPEELKTLLGPPFWRQLPPDEAEALKALMWPETP
ncbi:MAG: hypothetical protein H6739_42015 [Alphaproteobacteria bacterium]|nr:hypothetical protein [Alphaproteobacteria bacterium]